MSCVTLLPAGASDNYECASLHIVYAVRGPLELSMVLDGSYPTLHRKRLSHFEVVPKAVPVPDSDAMPRKNQVRVAVSALRSPHGH